MEAQTMSKAPCEPVPGASLAECEGIFPDLAAATVPVRRRMLRAAKWNLTLDERRLADPGVAGGAEETRARIRAIRLLLGRMKRVLDIYEKMYARQPLLAFLLMPGIDAMLASPGGGCDPSSSAAVRKAEDDCGHYVRQGVPLARELGAAIRRLRTDPCYAGLPPPAPDPSSSAPVP